MTKQKDSNNVDVLTPRKNRSRSSSPAIARTFEIQEDDAPNGKLEARCDFDSAEREETSLTSSDDESENWYRGERTPVSDETDSFTGSDCGIDDFDIYARIDILEYQGMLVKDDNLVIPERPVIKSKYGPCPMCTVVSREPVGCPKCRNFVGCRRCVNRWKRMARLRKQEYPGCPLCRDDWIDDGPVPMKKIKLEYEEQDETEGEDDEESEGEFDLTDEDEEEEMEMEEDETQEESDEEPNEDIIDVLVAAA
ncbi:unnamed protein product [Caenorhabditis bovis]|uniref:RING-type domain-containing protein n=1 Tax=Caenorhabditis bovis TaxID=2654633 RepID=A0A8S1FBE0_9PELO|nr:unnamed protein product [Caenorhabditis bovis]